MFAIFLPKLNKYARRMSYGSVALVKLPEQGTLYSRLSDATYRKKDIITYLGSIKPVYATVEIHEISFTHKVVKVI